MQSWLLMPDKQIDETFSYLIIWEKSNQKKDLIRWDNVSWKIKEFVYEWISFYCSLDNEILFNGIQSNVYFSLLSQIDI